MSVKERALKLPEILRNKRKLLFKAFDIYKENVAYGLDVETEQEHEDIKKWYLACLELDENAINNPPEKIIRYAK